MDANIILSHILSVLSSNFSLISLLVIISLILYGGKQRVRGIKDYIRLTSYFKEMIRRAMPDIKPCIIANRVYYIIATHMIEKSVYANEYNFKFISFNEVMSVIKSNISLKPDDFRNVELQIRHNISDLEVVYANTRLVLTLKQIPFLDVVAKSIMKKVSDHFKTEGTEK